MEINNEVKNEVNKALIKTTAYECIFPSFWGSSRPHSLFYTRREDEWRAGSWGLFGQKEWFVFPNKDT